AEGRAPPGAQHSASIKAITARQLQALVRQLPTSGLIRVLERCSVRLNEGVIAHPDIGAALDPDAAPLASDEHAVVLLHQLTKCCVVVGALVAFGRAHFQRRTLELCADGLLDVYREVPAGLTTGLERQEDARNHVLVVA